MLAAVLLFAAIPADARRDYLNRVADVAHRLDHPRPRASRSSPRRSSCRWRALLLARERRRLRQPPRPLAEPPRRRAAEWFPLLGLIGTVVAILQTFSSITPGSRPEPSEIIRKYAPAITATGGGLFMAFINILPSWVVGVGRDLIRALGGYAPPPESSARRRGERRDRSPAPVRHPVLHPAHRRPHPAVLHLPAHAVRQRPHERGALRRRRRRRPRSRCPTMSSTSRRCSARNSCASSGWRRNGRRTSRTGSWCGCWRSTARAALLFYYNPDRQEIRSQADAERYIFQEKKRATQDGTAKDVFFLILYPRSAVRSRPTHRSPDPPVVQGRAARGGCAVGETASSPALGQLASDRQGFRCAHPWLHSVVPPGLLFNEPRSGDRR